VTTQSKVIDAPRAGQEELKQEQLALISQNAELRKEICALREQLKSLSPSWASIVTSGTTATSSTNLSQPSQSSPQGSRENILRISTPPSPPEREADDNKLTRYMEASKASSLISEALKRDTSTQDPSSRDRNNQGWLPHTLPKQGSQGKSLQK
jgi:hypothetical protein